MAVPCSPVLPATVAVSVSFSIASTCLQERWAEDKQNCYVSQPSETTEKRQTDIKRKHM